MSDFQEISTGFVPRNNNPRLWITQQNDVKGGYHQYNTLEELMLLHPDKMLKGMSVTINAHPRTDGEYSTKTLKLLFVPDVSFYPLVIPPNELDIGGNEKQPLEPNANFYLNFWQVDSELPVNESTYAIEYAGDDANGIKPPYPYIDNPSGELLWDAVYIAGESKWYRERRSDATDSGTGIYLDWTVPRSINGNFEGGDYVQNLFIRAAVIPDLPGRYNKFGSINNFPEGWSDIPPLGTDPLYEIKAQKDVYGNLKTDWIGPFLIPENEDLVRYNAQSTPNPNPLSPSNALATAGSPADIALIAAGWVKTFDPSIHNYRALRTENSPLNYSSWSIDKISEESGEYIDKIYKLFSDTTDFNDPTFIAANTPIGNDPVSNTAGNSANIGWADTSYPEEASLINCYSEARKFFDGSLKTVWSAPKPFTGRDVYIDYISSDGQNTFKYPSSADAAAGTLSDPVAITLTANLFRGSEELTTNLTYKWYKVYNNKIIIPVNPNVDTPIATTKNIVIAPNYVTAKATFRCYITLINAGAEPDLVFIEEESITDITDGDDAKSLTLATDTPTLVYDTTSSSFPVSVVNIRGRQNFLDAVTFYWYRDDGAGNWLDLTIFANAAITIFADSATSPGVKTTVTSVAHGLSNGDQVNITGTTSYNGNFEISNVTIDTFDITVVFVADDATGNWNQNFYTLSNQILQIDTRDLFIEDGTAQTARFALSTANNINDVENIDEFFDIVTITKLASTSTGIPGTDSTSIILSNEVDSIILDRPTFLPVGGEIGTTGRIKTLIKIYDGPTKLDYTTDWSIVSLVSDTTDVSFGHQINGTDREIYIATWTSIIARKVNCAITINIGGTNFVKNFTVSSNLDSAGAVISFVQIDSGSANQSLAFTPENRSDIALKAVLDTNGTIISPVNYDGNVTWYFGNTLTVSNLSGTNNTIKTVTRGDVVGSLGVSCRIPYNGVVYISTPVSIDDITDAKTFRLYYNYAAAFDVSGNEPLATPTLPADLPTANFDSTFVNSGATSNWYKQSGSKTYFIVEGIVNNIAGVDTINWQPAYRNRGETGSQGDSPDFVVIYFKGSNSLTPPTIPVSSDASRSEMLSDGWLVTPNGIANTYTYQASTTFNGSDINILTAKANANWGVTRITGTASTIAGPSGTVSIGTTTTLAPGSSAVVTNTGTPEASVLNFGIPRGIDGIDGIDGQDGQDLAFSPPITMSGGRNISNYTNNVGRTRAIHYFWNGTMRSNSSSDSWMSCTFQLSVNNGASWFSLKNIVARLTNNDTATPVSYSYLSAIANGASMRWRVQVSFSNSSIENESSQVQYN